MLKRLRMPVLLLTAVISAFLCSRYFFQLLLIQGESMSPAYHNMDLTVLAKFTQDYEPGDVIAFRCDGLQAVLVKRIVAVPGDSAQIRDGTLYVNDSISSIYPQNGVFEYAGILSEKISLDNDEYLVIGDNLEKSKDSRFETVGIIHKEAVIGGILGDRKTIR